MEELTAFRKYLVEGKRAKPNDDLEDRMDYGDFGSVEDKETPIKESKEEEQVSAYWDIMVKNQPEDVIQMLTDLVTGKNTFDEFMLHVMDDMEDSFRDENFEDEDEFIDDED